MFLTKNEVAEMLLKYINHEIDLPTLVAWAEGALMESDFENKVLNS